MEWKIRPPVDAPYSVLGKERPQKKNRKLDVVNDVYHNQYFLNGEWLY